MVAIATDEQWATMEAYVAGEGGSVNPFRLTLGYGRAARGRGAELAPGQAAAASRRPL
jgi:hypothetical protein